MHSKWINFKAGWKQGSHSSPSDIVCGILDAAVFVFMIYQSYSWGVYWLKPIPALEETVDFWIPPEGSVVNPEGKVIVKKIDPFQYGSMTAELSMADFRTLKFVEGSMNSVLVITDGTMHYRSEIGGFVFYTKGYLASVSTVYKGLHSTMKPVAVTLLPESYAVIRYEKEWGMSVVAYFVSFVVCWIAAFMVTAVLSLLIAAIMARMSLRKARASIAS